MPDRNSEIPSLDAQLKSPGFVVDVISERFESPVGASTRPLGNDSRDARDEVTAIIRSGEWQFENVACLCGGTRFRVVSFRDRFGIPDPVSICRECGLVLANPRLRSEDYSRFYQSWYRRIYGGCSPEVLFDRQRGKGFVLRAWLAEHGIHLAPGDLVLEIGTGAGGILDAFRETGQEVMGCDFDEKFLQYGRDRGIPLVFGDASQLPHRGRARLAIVCHVFEHLPDPVRELSIFRSLLRPDGLLLIEVPGIDHEVGPYRPTGHKPYDFLDYQQGAHTYHFDRRSLERVVTSSGYSIVAIDDKITALLTPASSDGTSKTPPSPAAAANDASQPVLEKLRRLEQRRKKSLWFYSWAFPLAETLYSLVRITARRLGVVKILRKKRSRM